jgi:hypothetical protein
MPQPLPDSDDHVARTRARRTARWPWIWWTLVAAALIAVAVVHALGGGLGGHG